VATTTFPLSRIQRLRQEASRAVRTEAEPPEGWSVSLADPMDLLAVFKPLRLKAGFVLKAYEFYSGGNGNGVMWAVPAGGQFVEPGQGQQESRSLFDPPKPDSALDDIMDAIDGDGTAWSYLCASLFRREAEELGARWHGCDWDTHDFLGRNPVTASPATKRRLSLSATPPSDWRWVQREPEQWLPAVEESAGTMTVTFYTLSSYAQETIYRHRDRFRRGGYRFRSYRKAIAFGGGGFVF